MVSLQRKCIKKSEDKKKKKSGFAIEYFMNF